jgi:D-aminoacyl-tRNA deacylase
MIILLQRVSEASVRVDDEIVGEIGPGLLALAAIQPGDDEAAVERLVDRMLAYRVFADAEGRMNLSVTETGGSVLLVSQFTLAADTGKGLRPSFTSAADPAVGQRLFEAAVAHARTRLPGRVATGRFGAHMRVTLVNDGPVTFWLESAGKSATSRA